MKEYQDRNDIKAKKFSDYMYGKDLAALSRQDEERYVKAMADKELRERKEEERNKLKFQSNKQHNQEMLKQQMMDKQQQRRIKQMEDEAFAALIRQQVSDGN
mmetsp:Transcript_23955/g.36707  ORF Transcript_23955/g.36707 Transcript_23955/m.36707 type:complete len:102 (+) Transcript_23955:1930-2235(+)